MKFTLKNVGLIKNSEIKLDGLTVITGHNNSGKTTVGKALYACIEGASNIETKYENYKNKYMLQANRRFFFILLDIDEQLKKYLRQKKFKEQFKEYLDEIKNLIKHIENMLTSVAQLKQKILDCINFLETNELIHLLTSKDENLTLTIKHTVSSLKEDIIKDIEKVNNYTLADFMKDNLNLMLRTEFSQQIQPVKNKNKSLISEIKISVDNIDILNIGITNNNIINDKSAYKYIKYNNTFLIDNPFIIDDLDKIYSHKFKHNGLAQLYIENMASYDRQDLNNINKLHNDKLKEALITDNYSKNIFEKGVNKGLYKNINNVINETIPGVIRLKKQKTGFEYVHEHYSLHLSNLATGTKLFAIMKTLIDKGAIDDNTILILDEPESHLHPEWQNIFAELLILLVKDVNCRILLTTHSPNFLLAIEAFMYKHSIVDKCNFYKTQFNNDNETVDYVLTNNTNEIYGDFVKFLSQVKQIRNTYAHYKEDIDNE